MEQDANGRTSMFYLVSTYQLLTNVRNDRVFESVRFLCLGGYFMERKRESNTIKDP